MDQSTPTQRAAVELHIDELVLHGFPARDRHAIAAALEGELSRLIAAGDVGQSAWNSIRLDRVDAGSIRLPASAPPGQVGQTVAQNVYRQIAPGVGANSVGTGGQGHA